MTRILQGRIGAEIQESSRHSELGGRCSERTGRCADDGQRMWSLAVDEGAGVIHSVRRVCAAHGILVARKNR